MGAVTTWALLKRARITGQRSSLGGLALRVLSFICGAIASGRIAVGLGIGVGIIRGILKTPPTPERDRPWWASKCVLRAGVWSLNRIGLLYPRELPDAVGHC